MLCARGHTAIPVPMKGIKMAARGEIAEAMEIKGYRAASEHYEKGRPSYPREGVELLMNKLGLTGENRDKTTQLTVLELGAGTGKFTRVMAEVLRDANVRIIASDPVKEMCEQFKQMQPNIEIRQFGAENIDLPDGSVDVVIAATSFHWVVYKENALAKIHQVLSPNGMLGVTWLLPDKESQPFAKEMAEYLRSFFPDSRECVAVHEDKIVQQIGLSKRFTKADDAYFLSHCQCSTEQFCQVTLSFGVVQVMSPKDRDAFFAFLKKSMADHVARSGHEINSVDWRMSLYWSKKLKYKPNVHRTPNSTLTQY